MSKELTKKITSVFEKHQVGTLATIQDNRPFSRFMLFFHDGLTLYTATNKNTHKMKDIQTNPYAHILLGVEGKGWEDDYVEIEAKIEVENDANTKEKFWNEQLYKWLNGPNDPEYVLLKLVPEKIRYIEKAGANPETITC
jgi:general stress protein 26